MTDKLLTLLGLMRRANALTVGELNSGAAAKSGKAKLLLLSSDASENAQKRAAGFVYGREIPLVHLSFTKAELSQSLGLSGCSMLAVLDEGFAAAYAKALAERFGDEYTELSQRLAAKGTAQNNRNGKRRKCV